MINEVADGLNGLMWNLHKNANDELLYKNDVILSPPSGRRENFEHKKQTYSDMYTSKFDEIILETQIQLHRRFKDFDALSLQNMCQLFDFKLWPKSFNTDHKKWGFDVA